VDEASGVWERERAEHKANNQAAPCLELAATHLVSNTALSGGALASALRQ